MSLFGADFRRAKSEWLYPVEPQQNVWRGLGIVVLLFATFVILINAIVLVAVFTGLGALLGNLSAGDQAQYVNTLGLLATLPATAILVPLGFYLARFGRPQRQGKLPLAWPKLGFLGWLVVVAAVVAGMLVVFSGTFWLIGLSPEKIQGVAENTIKALVHDPVVFPVLAIIVVICAPFSEELLFRGYVLASLRQTPIGTWGAVGVSAALWAVAHGLGANWIAMACLFVLGIVLGLAVLRFGSLWVSIICHAMWNAVSISGLLLGSGGS